LKKQKAKKSGAKSEEAPAPAESSKTEQKTAEEGPEPEESEVSAPAEESTPSVKIAEKEEDIPTQRTRQPSISVQSKLRSTSFRQSSTSGPLSPSTAFGPEGDTAPEIYRKQAVRIDELERENNRLTKEASDSERRWKKAEEELEDLREAEGSGPSSQAGAAGEEFEKLVSLV
jgi:hypothetical protein